MTPIGTSDADNSRPQRNRKPSPRAAEAKEYEQLENQQIQATVPRASEPADAQRVNNELEARSSTYEASTSSGSKRKRTASLKKQEADASAPTQSKGRTARRSGQSSPQPSSPRKKSRVEGASGAGPSGEAAPLMEQAPVIEPMGLAQAQPAELTHAHPFELTHAQPIDREQAQLVDLALVQPLELAQAPKKNDTMAKCLYFVDNVVRHLSHSAEFLNHNKPSVEEMDAIAGLTALQDANPSTLCDKYAAAEPVAAC